MNLSMGKLKTILLIVITLLIILFSSSYIYVDLAKKEKSYSNNSTLSEKKGYGYTELGYACASGYQNLNECKRALWVNHGVNEFMYQSVVEAFD